MGDSEFFSQSFLGKKQSRIKKLNKNLQEGFSPLEFHTAAMDLKKDIVKNFQETLFKNAEFLEEIKKKISDKVPEGEVYGIFLENCNSRMASEDLSLTEDQKTLLSSLFEQKDDPDINSCNLALLGPLKEWLSSRAELTPELLEKLNKDLDTVFDVEQAKLQEVETARQDAAAARVEADEKTEAEAFPEDKKAAAPASGWLSWGVSFIPGMSYRKAEVASPEPNLQAEWDLDTLLKVTSQKNPSFPIEMSPPNEGQQFNDFNRNKTTEIIFPDKQRTEFKGFQSKEQEDQFKKDINDVFKQIKESLDKINPDENPDGKNGILAQKLKEYCHQGGYFNRAESGVTYFFQPDLVLSNFERSSKLEILEDGTVRFTETSDFTEIQDVTDRYKLKGKGALRVKGKIICTSFLSLNEKGELLQQTKGKVEVISSESPELTQLFTALNKEVQAAEVAAAAQAVPAAGLATTVISGIGSGIGSGLSTVAWGVGSAFTGVRSGVGSAVTSVANMGGAVVGAGGAVVGAVSSRLRPQELELELGLELGLELECTLDSLSRVSNKKLESQGLISELEKIPETVVQAPQGKKSEQILKQKIGEFFKEGRENVPAALVSSFFIADQVKVNIKKNNQQSLLERSEDGESYKLTQAFDFSEINDTGNKYKLKLKGDVKVAGTMTCTSILSLDENGELQQTEGQVKINSKSPELKTLLTSLKKKIESLGENLEAEWDLDVLSQIMEQKKPEFLLKMIAGGDSEVFDDLNRTAKTEIIFPNGEKVELEGFSGSREGGVEKFKQEIKAAFHKISGPDGKNAVLAKNLEKYCHQSGFLYTAETVVKMLCFVSSSIMISEGERSSKFEILQDGTVKFTETCSFIKVQNGGSEEKYGLAGKGGEEEVTGTLTCTSILSLDADGNLQQTKGKVKVTSSDSLLLKQLFSELDKDFNLIMGTDVKIEVEAQVEEERKDKAEEDHELERKPTKPVIFSQPPAEGTARPEVTPPKAEEDKEAEAVDKPSSPKI